MSTQQTAAPTLVRIPTRQLDHGPNARGDLGDVGDVAELALSMNVLGQLEPIQVYPAGERYHVHEGNRRLKAARQIGLPHLDAVVLPQRPATDALRIQRQIAIHANRKAFDPIAEAKALHELMFEHNMTREAISRAVGKTPAWVRDRISLLVLTDAEQQQVSRGVMPLGEALLRARVRRGERDGRPVVQAPLNVLTTSSVAVPHCATCRCGRRSQ